MVMIQPVLYAYSFNGPPEVSEHIVSKMFLSGIEILKNVFFFLNIVRRVMRLFLSLASTEQLFYFLKDFGSPNVA